MARQKRQRWYDAQGQKRIHISALEKSSGIRRILSLIILLAMVLILIQQTSDVKKVEKVATAIGLLPNANTEIAIPLEVVTDQALNPNSVFDRRVDEPTLEQVALQASSPRVRTDHSIWKALLKKGNDAAIASLARKLFGQTTTEEPRKSTMATNWPMVMEWYAQSKLQLEKWVEIEARNSITGTATMDFSILFQDQAPWFATPTYDVPKSSNDFFRGLKLAVDERLLDQVVDNSPWWTSDRLPFARSWQRIDALRELLANKIASHRHFNKMEISQLLAGGQSYRGRPVLFEGTIFRVDPVTTFFESDFGSHSYYGIWLKPDGLSNQPVCVYVPETNIDPSVKLEKDTTVSITGFFFKRMAYASQRGSDIAPLLLAAYLKPIESTDLAEPLVNPFVLLGRSGLESKTWHAPVDTATPYSMVAMSLERVLTLMNEEVLKEAFQGTNVTDATVPLVELERLAPEISLLLANQTDWPISKSASISRLSGMVTKVERIAMDSQLTRKEDLPNGYRCRIENGDSSIVLLCNYVPSGWLHADGTPFDVIRQPCVADALKLTQNDGRQVAWAKKAQWKLLEQQNSLDTTKYEPEVSSSLRFLLEQGWDLSWIDILREQVSEQIRPLSSRELEPYFALMRLSNQTPYGDVKPARTIPDLIETFRQKQKGSIPAMERVAMNMRIVRVTRVQLDNPAEIAMLGSDQYFQLDTMADIGDRTYEIKTESESIVYHREYPVTCVAVELPSWLINMDANSNSDAASRNEQVWYPRLKSNASGWFYRFWSYKTQETSQSLGEYRKQVGPLIVLDHLALGNTTMQSEQQGVSQGTANTATIVIGVLGTIGIWWFVRRSTAKRLF